MSTIQDFSGYNPTWCPGCGDWGIGIAIKQAFVQLGFDPSGVAVVFGIGCSGNMNDFLNAYAIHSLHGRAIPNAIGIKLANHNLPVVAIVGDGDCYGEGGNHLIHACRGNHDITVIVHDNGVYGLTTGQVAPTASKGFKSKSTPSGIIEIPINPLSLAITSGATFVAQAFAGDANGTIALIKEGVNHKGFSLINILQPCVTFNKINTYQYYLQKTYKLPADFEKDNFKLAVEKSLEINEEKFPLGVIYQIKRPTFTDQLPQLEKETLVNKERFVDFDSLIKDFI
ncbi:MAG: 2-oxoacid:ferredoxin oxidoreductase subunit beta [Candidatus Roizmanbacteria bacterium GW2011_GWC2_37_13]|uniref:2-oxoacid:ferredoxin oxidoreductase subunit beta n=1 Tax=Candidatus Roizmanbacteria bacterium GW2011_GWC2_37_13 TaxID=1618486 RepID=A0A0G0G600_9BACT|nr:MAG: 2-oxoacid:ferredoxin oxidoreductase subunit beta [Candidatus Roizmanbacteria bacterium GW2011_GWC1_37_12]KKQ26543.1 MAG: 2-oxoacid:ferredoxin oxidoreductase subunit beta [Candidatus Roizmanbacteria bacterium GW2011_GWC2_37_13]